MRLHTRIAAAMCGCMFLLAGCASSGHTGTVPAVQLSGKITDVNLKWGNVYIDASETDLQNAGIEVGDIVVFTIQGIAYTAPVVTDFSDVDAGAFLVHMSGGKIDFAMCKDNCAVKTHAVSGGEYTVLLKSKGGYAEEYEMRHLVKTDNRSDYESDAVFANARMVDMPAVKKGVLFRSCNPVLGDARSPYADAFAGKNAVQTVLNLADSEQSYLKRRPNLPAGYYSGLYENGSVVFLDMGEYVLNDDFCQGLGKGIRFLLSHPAPYLIHCNEGKDRAGIVCALFEALAGSSLADIQTDYMQSYINLYHVEKGSAKYEKIRGVITGVCKKIGGGKEVTDQNIRRIVETYLKERIHLTESEIAELQERITEKTYQR